MIYDVAIVGAGPAGAFLAYLLAKQGRRVALVDKSSFPRTKVCGGGLSPKALELLGREFDVSPVVHRRIESAYLVYGDVEGPTRSLRDQPGAMVVRSELDHFILQRAREQGATFHPDTAFLDASSDADVVTITTSKGILRARHLIGADGVFSRVRELLFGRGAIRYVPCVEALVSVDATTLERFERTVLFDLGALPHGYGWIFPKRDHLNVGVFSTFPQGHRHIKRHLSRFIAGSRWLRNGTVAGVRGFCIPQGNCAEAYERGSVWLVGDAAGFAESLFGEGIYFALESARIAGDVIGTESGVPLPGRYGEALQRSGLLSQLRFSAWNARLVFTFPRFAFRTMVKSTSASQPFVSLINGALNHKECFLRTVLTAPLWSVDLGAETWGIWRRANRSGQQTDH